MFTLRELLVFAFISRLLVFPFELLSKKHYKYRFPSCDDLYEYMIVLVATRIIVVLTGLGMPRVFVSASDEAFKNAVVEEIHSVLRMTTSDRRTVAVGLSGLSINWVIFCVLIPLI